MRYKTTKGAFLCNRRPPGALRLLEVAVSTSLAPPASGGTLPLGRRELVAAVWPGEGQSRVRLTGLLAELNDPQRQVATRPDGPLLVVAGPGAGKTRAIVARVAHLLLGRGVPADEIMAITFSRRAAGELEERLAALMGPASEPSLPAGEGDRPAQRRVGGVSHRPESRTAPAAGAPSAGSGAAVDDGRRVWAGTFHALGARLLRRGGAAHFGRPLTFTIYDQDDSERILRRVLASLGVPDNRAGRLAAVARQAISLAKRQALGDGAQLQEATIGEGAEAVPLRDVLSRYDAGLREGAAFDFDDLVGSATAALDLDPALRAWAQARARHLLVDEYQDTDPAQEALLRRLSPPAAPRRAAPGGPAAGEPVPGVPGDLCVVADPQQSIYAFRGGVPEQVHRFIDHWPGAGLVRLEQNYRSTKSLVAIARRLVAPSPGPRSSPAAGLPGADLAAGRFALRLWTENPPGVPARLWIAPHPDKEADAIARDIAARLAAGWSPEELAILVRTHAQARPIEAALLRAKVPYALFGGVRFFGREEIKDALAYLRLAILYEDAAAFWRVVNTPRRGLGPAALLTIARHAIAGAPGVASPSSASERGPVAASRRWAATESAPDGLYDLLAHLDELTGLARSGYGPAALLEAALDRTHYREYLRRAHPDDAPTRLDALAELLRLAGTYADSRQFLDDAVLSGEDDDPVARGRGRIRLSTVHAAKGLEFRAIYVPGCEQGLFPLGGAPGGARRPPLPHSAAAYPAPSPGGGEPSADPEERRVFYVAVTRAKELLTLSYCTFRRDERTQPSPFLAQIGRGLLRRARLGSDEPPPPRRRTASGRPGPDDASSNAEPSAGDGQAGE